MIKTTKALNFCRSGQLLVSNGPYWMGTTQIVIEWLMSFYAITWNVCPNILETFDIYVFRRFSFIINFNYFCLPILLDIDKLLSLPRILLLNCIICHLRDILYIGTRNSYVFITYVLFWTHVSPGISLPKIS